MWEIQFPGRKSSNRDIWLAFGVALGLLAWLFLPGGIGLPDEMDLFPIEAGKSLELKLAPQDFKKLENSRLQALKTGFLMPQDQVFVPGRIEFDGKSYPVRVRLKGDLLDHLEGRQWSFRIQVLKDQAILGMRRFSLQHPKTRQGLQEWFFQRHLRHLGLIALRYDFVSFRLNGEDFGTYAVEEHFRKELVESNRRREGPVLRFDEEAMWQSLLNRKEDAPQILSWEGDQDLDWEPAPIREFTGVDAKIVEEARQLLEDFRDEHKSPSEVFDLKKMARFLAVLDLHGAGHAVAWHNLRFYFDPISKKLEPIGFDGELTRIRSLLGLSLHWSQSEGPESNRILKLLFADMELFRLYLQELEKLSDAAKIQEFLALSDRELSENLDIERPNWRELGMDERFLIENALTIRRLIQPMRLAEARCVRREGRSFLEVAAMQSLPVEIRGLGAEDLISAAVLPGRKRQSPPIYHFQKEFACESLSQIRVSLLGLKRMQRIPVRQESSSEAEKPGELTRAVLDKDGLFRLGPGRVQIRKPVQVKGLRIHPGTELDLVDGAWIWITGQLEALGTEDQPIRVFSSDLSGRGILVLGEGLESAVSFTRFENLKELNRPGWPVTGAVTFQDTFLRMDSVYFGNMQAEDALNLVRTRFELRRLRFENNSSDALDLDFSEGSIQISEFQNQEGDGLDLSGSRVRAEQSSFFGAGDKCISVGELSDFYGSHLMLHSCAMGLASKDGSTAVLSRSVLRNLPLGLAVFQKKAEYPSPSLEAEQVEFIEVEELFLVETHASLKLDGMEQAP